MIPPWPPCPSLPRDAVLRWLEGACTEGDTVGRNGSLHWKNGRRAAITLRADPSEIALIANTTTGIGLVAGGFPFWQIGDNIVTLANEFPYSNLYPWTNLASRGVTTKLVPVEVGRVDLNACSGR